MVKDGVVYTPKNIVDKILSKINIKGSILEPSCGTGNFIAELSGDIDAFDIDANALKTAKKRNSKVNYFCEDFLKHDFKDKKYDTIIGNPPYIKFQNLDKNYRKFLQDSFYSCQNGNIDIFYAFIEKCISLLKNDGELSLIVPNSWLTNKSAYSLRNILKDYDVEMFDYDTDKNFENADTYTLILFLKKRSGKIKLIKNKKEIEIEKTAEPWVSEKINSKIDLSIIKNGIATLYDKAFIFNKFEKNENTTRVFCEYNKKWYDIENGIIKNVVKISKFKTDICIYPYDNNGTPFSEEELKTNYPLAYSYLNDIKPRLLERTYDTEWYLYGRTQGLLDMYGRKILISTIMLDKIKYCILDDKEAVVYSGLFINIDKMSNEEIENIISFLNNKELNEFIVKNGKAMSGGYHSFSKTLLKAAIE